MKIAVVGAGAMGTFITARLCMAGHEVWLLEKNGQRVKNIRKKGIFLDKKDKSWNSKFNSITSDAADIGTAEVVIIMVKAFDTEAAVQRVLPVVSEKTVVLTLQNGIGNVELICNHISKEQVLAGTTSHGALFIEDGHVRHTGEGDTIIGALAANSESYTEKIKRVFDGSEINTAVSNDISSLLWGKLLINMSINPLTAIMRINNGSIPEMPHLVEIIKKVLAEGVKVASSLGVRLPYDDPLKKVFDVCRNTSANNSSMLQDILAGRKTEINQINGTVVSYGKKYGILTPVNRTLTELVMSIEQIK